jgi:hypothetical protein
MVGIYFTKNNMTVLQIHEELAFAVISFFPAFVAKNQLSEKGSGIIVIPALPNNQVQQIYAQLQKEREVHFFCDL